MSNLSAQDLPAFSSSNFAVDVNVENEGGGFPGRNAGPRRRRGPRAASVVPRLKLSQMDALS